MSTNKYILDGHTPVPCDDLLKWARWYETHDRFVAKNIFTRNGSSVRVSTVFLALNHRFGSGPPLLFETMVFGGDYDFEQERYSTWEEAEAGHARWLDKVIGT